MVTSRAKIFGGLCTGERMGSGAAKLIQWAQDEHTDRWLINRLAQALYDFCSAEDAAERARPWLSELIRKANDENATWWDKIKTSMTGKRSIGSMIG